MKKFLFPIAFILMVHFASAQTQKPDTGRVDSTQRELIHKMPMDTIHEQAPVRHKHDTTKQLRPDDAIRRDTLGLK